MELTKHEQKILRDCRNEGGWLAGTYLRKPWWGPSLGFLILVAVGYFFSAVREIIYIYVFIGTVGYLVSTAILFSKIKALINKLTNRIEELEKRK